MPRNSSGTYSLPESPFVPSTPISSTAVNSNNDDLATAMTDSLSRSGDGGMLSQLSLNPGGFVYSGDDDTGMSRSGSNIQIITCGGTNIITATTAGVTIAGALAVTGALTVGGNPLLLVGEIKIFSGRTAPALWLECGGQTLLRASYPALWAFAEVEIANSNILFTSGDGSTTFTIPDLRGRAPFGNDAMAGTPPNRLTALTMTPSGDTYGAVGGAQLVTLAANQIPAGVPSANAAQAISVTSASTQVVQSAGAPDNFTSVVGSTTFDNLTRSAIASSGNNSISVTSTNASQQAVLNMPPAIIVNFIIYAGA